MTDILQHRRLRNIKPNNNMAHGGYDKRRPAAAERRKPVGNQRSKALAVDKKSKPNKPKTASLKNQIRSTERMLLRKELPKEVMEALTKKLGGLKEQQETQNRLAVERKIFLRNKRIRFFERSKIERRIKRLGKQQQTSIGEVQEAEIVDQLSKLKEDLEYVKFFPKTEKYVSLFMGGDETEIVEKRNNLRKQIKANTVAAAASGKELEETGNEDDVILDPSDDDFFLNGSSSDEAEADDEGTEKSTREQASSASGKTPPAISSDERNQGQISARALIPPPDPSCKQFSSSLKNTPRFAASSDKKSYSRAEISLKNTSRFVGSSDKKSYNRAEISTTSNTSIRKRRPTDSTNETCSNLIANSDARNRSEISTLSNISSSNGRSSSRKRGHVDLRNGNSSNPMWVPTDSTNGNSNNRKWVTVNSTNGNSSNLSFNSDVRKPRRKRRPKKKKQ